jgi:hypothetical protein
MERWAVLACCTLLLHCGGSTDATSDTGTGGTSGASTGGTSGASTGGTSGTGAGGSTNACAGYTPQAEPGEIAATPRANATAEILALEASDTLVAPEALYQRVASEVEAIVQDEPALAPLDPSTDAAIDDVRVDFTDEGWKQVVAGDYHAWDCANAAYAGTPTLNSQWHFAAVSFGDKVYRGAMLEQEYDALPNCQASRDTYFYDGPDVCLEVQGDGHFYIFDNATGDCPSGCMYHAYTGYQALPSSPPTKLGTFDPTQSPEPPWFTALTDCRSRL